MGRSGLGVITAMALLLPGRPAAAQGVSPFLPTDHWAVEAVRRLDAAGVAGPGVDPVTRSMTVNEALQRFAAASAAGNGGAAHLAAGYGARLAAELGADPASPSLVPGTPSLYGEGVLGYADADGLLAPGTSTPGLEEWSGPRSLSRENGVAAGLRVGARLSPHVAGAVAARSTGEDAALAEAYVMGGVGALGAWLGRRPVGYRVGTGGGVVLDALRVDGGGVYLTAPIDLPWVGAVRAETDVTRVADNGTIGRPWLWSSRLALEPHPRLRLGVTRAVMFSGDDHEPITLRNVLYMIVGKHGSAGSGFENQVVSLDLHYRPPLPAPVVFRVEWGFDDSAGAWWDQPAIVVAGELAAVPGAPWLALGLEHTRIAGAVEGHSIWYRHWRFLDGWVDGDALLGHPLGGHGNEWLGHATGDLVDRGILWDARVFLRDRGDYNVFAPDRAGSSAGAAVDVEWRIANGLDLVGGGSWEEGRDWRETTFRVAARLRTGFGRP